MTASLAGAVTDEVAEVDHLLRDGVCGREVPAREELAEVQLVAVHVAGEATGLVSGLENRPGSRCQR